MESAIKEFTADLNRLIARCQELENLAAMEEQKPKNPFLTFAQACEYLGLTANSLYTMTCRKRIPYYKPTGKNIYFLESDLLAWIQSKRIDTADETESQAAALCTR